MGISDRHPENDRLQMGKIKLREFRIYKNGSHGWDKIQ
jgi:hypothetical protein